MLDAGRGRRRRGEDPRLPVGVKGFEPRTMYVYACLCEHERMGGAVTNSVRVSLHQGAAPGGH